MEVKVRQSEFSLGRANVGSSGLNPRTRDYLPLTDKQYVQNTSLEALPPKLKREAMNRQVWYFLRALPDSTMKEISKGTDIELQTICWRIHDLRNENSIEEIGTKICDGKLMKTWKTKPLNISGSQNDMCRG